MLDRQALVLFSGGSDSTFCAAQLAEQFTLVHLLTCNRISFFGAKTYTQKNYDRLCKIYGQHSFVRKVVSIEKLHKRICFENYFNIACKYRLAVTALTFSKLAMHWYCCEYSLANKISVVADGSVPYMDMYPDQNKKIALNQLQDFYAYFGIEYQNPAYNKWNDIEDRLFDKGITDQPRVRGTQKDKQVTYAEQVIFALFLKYYKQRHGMRRYEDVLSELYTDRLNMIKRHIRNSNVDRSSISSNS